MVEEETAVAEVGGSVEADLVVEASAAEEEANDDEEAETEEAHLGDEEAHKVHLHDHLKQLPLHEHRDPSTCTSARAQTPRPRHR